MTSASTAQAVEPKVMLFLGPFCRKNQEMLVYDISSQVMLDLYNQAEKKEQVEQNVPGYRDFIQHIRAHYQNPSNQLKPVYVIKSIDPNSDEFGDGIDRFEVLPCPGLVDSQNIGHDIPTGDRLCIWERSMDLGPNNIAAGLTLTNTTGPNIAIDRAEIFALYRDDDTTVFVNSGLGHACLATRCVNRGPGPREREDGMYGDVDELVPYRDEVFTDCGVTFAWKVSHHADPNQAELWRHRFVGRDREFQTDEMKGDRNACLALVGRYLPVPKLNRAGDDGAVVMLDLSGKYSDVELNAWNHDVPGVDPLPALLAMLSKIDRIQL